jgi:biopolymer transport protein ExbD
MGTYMVNGTTVSLEALKEKLHTIRSAGSTPSLHINASREATYEAVGRAVKAANDVGASVAFVTSPPKP